MTTRTSHPSITIGVVPRERFSVAAECIQLLYERTNLEFELIYVDTLTPRRYMAQIESQLEGRDNARIIHSDEWLLPNQSKQLIGEESTTELTCVMETDVFVLDGWLTSLVEAMAETSADVVVPRTFEGSTETNHGDRNLGHFVFTETEEGKVLSITPLDPEVASGAVLNRLTEIDASEPHCYLFRTDILKRIEPFREPVNTRDLVEISLALRAGGAKCVYQPANQVIFMSPPPVNRDERAHYLFRWDLDTAAWSHVRVKEKWGLAQMHDSMTFVKGRRAQTSQWSWQWFRFKLQLPPRIARIQRALRTPFTMFRARHKLAKKPSSD